MEDRYLFKAKRIDNGEWVLGALFDGESHCIIGQEIKFEACSNEEYEILARREPTTNELHAIINHLAEKLYPYEHAN